MNLSIVEFSEIEKVALKIATHFNVDKIILFGSYAYGKPNPNSDVDLLVVMKTDRRPLQHRLEITKSLIPFHFGLDIIVRSKEEIERRISIGDFFLHEAYTKGKTIYERRSN